MADFDIYNGLRQFLMTDPDDWGAASAEDQARRIAARQAIASLVTSRIYPRKLPQNSPTPSIVLSLVATRPASVLKGAASMDWTTFQIDAWVREESNISAFARVRTLGAAIRGRLEGYVGLLTDASTSPAGRAHASIEWLDARDGYETDAVGGLYRFSADIRIGHSVRTS